MNFDLESLIRPLDGYDKNMPGYDHRKGWNDAIKHVMDLQRATAAPTSTPEPVAWTSRADLDLIKEHWPMIGVLNASCIKTPAHDIPLFAGPKVVT